MMQIESTAHAIRRQRSIAAIHRERAQLLKTDDLLSLEAAKLRDLLKRCAGGLSVGRPEREADTTAEKFRARLRDVDRSRDALALRILQLETVRL